MTKNELIAHRAAAGAAYAAAAAAYVQASIDLHAFDIVCSNGLVQAIDSNQAGSHLATVHGHPQFLTGAALEELQHDPVKRARDKASAMLDNLG